MDLVAVDERPVAGSEVLDDDSVRGRGQPGVLSRDQRVAREFDAGVFLSSDLGRLLGERDLPTGLGALDDLEYLLAHTRA